MKTIVKSVLLIAVVLFGASSAFANETEPNADNSKVVITTNEDEAIMTLRLFNLDMEVTSVKIKDQNDNLIYFKKIKNNKEFAYRINVSQLTEGDYQLYVNREQKRFVQPFTVENSEIVAGTLKEIIKPSVLLDDNSFTVTQKGILITNVSVLTPKGDLLYSKDFDEKAGEAAKLKFNLENNFTGKYVVRIQTADEDYYEDIDIK